MKRTGFQLLPGPTLCIGSAAIVIKPRDGLRLAEQLARLSFRQVLTEEASAATRPARKRISANGC
jgi:hypothetical protein